MPTTVPIPDDSAAFFKKNPDITVLEAFIVDLNGVLRGKWIPADNIGKVFDKGLRLPRSSHVLDIWGQDVFDAGLVVHTGDTDGICQPVPGSLSVVPWLDTPVAQIMLTMEEPDGQPFFGDPRQLLRKLAERCRSLGFRAVAAVEQEFYLIDSQATEQGGPQPPVFPRTGARQNKAQTYALSEMAEFHAFFGEVTQACRAQNIPVDTLISENGPGQCEITLKHTDDIVRAADQALLMKRAIKGVAHKHGIDASFMAKPYPDLSGNGMHIHISLVDDKGCNVFAGKDNKGSPLLRHAIGGLLATMEDAMALFAPHLNSYRRFQKNSHAPTKATWGYDNRLAAVRVPESSPEATRIEHRVSGADANPYLVLSVILAGMLYGIENKIDPGSPAEGNAYQSKAKTLPSTWDKAVRRFARSDFISEYLGSDFRHVFTACKKQEYEQIHTRISNIEYDAYLRSV